MDDTEYTFFYGYAALHKKFLKILSLFQRRICAYFLMVIILACARKKSAKYQLCIYSPVLTANILEIIYLSRC